MHDVTVDVDVQPWSVTMAKCPCLCCRGEIRCPTERCTLLCLSGHHFERRPDPKRTTPKENEHG